MSTNYYLRTPDMAGGDEGIHLGQHTAGGFTFRAHPDRGIVDYATWRAQLSTGTVYDEYGHAVTRDELIGVTFLAPVRSVPWVMRGSAFEGGFYDMEGRRWLTVDFF